MCIFANHTKSQLKIIQNRSWKSYKIAVENHTKSQLKNVSS